MLSSNKSHDRMLLSMVRVEQWMEVVPELWETRKLAFKLPQNHCLKKKSENRRGHQGRAAKTKNLWETSCWRREMPECPNNVPGAWVLLTGFGNGAIKRISALLLNL